VSVRTHSPTPILKYGRGTLLRFYRKKPLQILMSEETLKADVSKYATVP
jgi:hypothetical protein